MAQKAYQSVKSSAILLGCAISLLLLQFAQVFGSADKFQPRALHIGLHADWTNTRLSAEATAWIASSEGNRTAWRFLNAMTETILQTASSQTASDSSPSSADTIHWVASSDFEENKLVESSLSSVFDHDELSLGVIRWAISSRQMSPRVYMHYTQGLSALNAISQSSGAEHARSAINYNVFALRFDESSARMQLLGDPAVCSSSAGCPGATKKRPLFMADIHATGSHIEPLATEFPTDLILGTHCIGVYKPTVTVILYANIASASFATWHSALVGNARTCQARYVLRYWRPGFDGGVRKENEPRPGLQGYAVDIAVKSTEYKVLDDRVFKHRLFPDCAYGVDCNTSAPEDLTAPAADVAVNMEAFKHPFVGISVAEHIANEARGSVQGALTALKNVAESAPATLPHIIDEESEAPTGEKSQSAMELSEAILQTIGTNDALFINGRIMPASKALSENFGKVLSCMGSIATASRVLRKHFGNNLPGPGLGPLLHRSQDDSSALSLRVLFDAPDAEDIIVWYNDLRKDSRYKSWRSFGNSSEDIDFYLSKVAEAKEVAKGDHRSLVKVRENLLSFLLALDPGDPAQMGFLTIPENIVRGDIPMRAGLILVPNDVVSTMMTAAFHYFRISKGRKAAVSFLSTINTILDYMGASYGGGSLSPQLVELAFQQVITSGSSKVPPKYQSIEAMLEHDDQINGILDRSRRWAESMSLFSAKGSDFETENTESRSANSGNDESDSGGTTRKNSPPRAFSMVGTINGILLKDIASDTLPMAVKEQARIADLLKDTRKSRGSIEDKRSVGSWTMRDPSLVVIKKVSKLLLPQLPQHRETSKRIPRRLSLQEILNHKGEWEALNYNTAEKQKENEAGLPSSGAVTVWLMSCKQTSEEYLSSKKLLEEFTKSSLSRRSNVRVGYVPQGSEFSRLVTKCVDYEERDRDTLYIINSRIIAARQLGTVEDLKAEVAAEFLTKASKFGGSLSEKENVWDAALIAAAAVHDIDEACSSVSSGETQGSSGNELENLLNLLKHQEKEIFSFPTPKELATGSQLQDLSVVAVTDPLGDSASTTSFLNSLTVAFPSRSYFLGLILAPRVGVRNEIPNSRQVFRHFVLSPRIQFAPVTGYRISPRAVFQLLPQKRILTVDIKQPRPWFIASHATNYDMDNVILSNLPANVSVLHAEYVLKSLLVEGSCIDELSRPPQGLQLVLASPQSSAVDTLVMGNLGYFQLRVPRPGIWSLSLAAGRSQQLFHIRTIDSRLSAMYGGAAAAEHTFSSNSLGEIGVSVDSLDGATGSLLRVQRKPGMEGMKILDPYARIDLSKKGRAALGPFRGLQRFIRNIINRWGSHSDVKSRSQETINVFSVASGHLYERFLKIMMLSVKKHASRPVKFWLLENYLSPSFKKFLPHFAEQNGFEVGMVTYRWPGWLREQSEKQRIIWAYKILYLDVLFPLSIKRIIFVDSDQVVRSDLAELIDIDLKGAPYGYVPFCDSRKEVEGYRFWKTGFWEKTLRGAKYHISALYVVDLEHLRETAAGDKLRFIYQSLSADPNSLSNLDQDLPNYAAVVPAAGGETVPIFDLPQEWLWCESWCDDASKKSAKTIDLCNNPMTKEPKLVSAKRIVSEWTQLDDEASFATENIYSNIVAQDRAGQPLLDSQVPVLTADNSLRVDSTNNNEKKEEL